MPDSEKLLEKIKELEQKVEGQQEKINKLESKLGDSKEETLNREISRRQFLKKLGVGALGLGALSLPSASALNVRSDGFNFYGGQSSSLDFDVDNNGNIQAYGSLDMGNSKITDLSDPDNAKDAANKSWVESKTSSGGGLKGDGSGGNITQSGFQRACLIQATDYTLESGATLRVRNGFGVIVILANNSITINGTVDASGSGAPGGSGKTSTTSFAAGNGAPGSDGYFTGDGGAGSNSSGGRGANGGTSPSTAQELTESLGVSIESKFFRSTFGAGAGGGGGYATGDAGGTTGRGGDGGNGGGLIILSAPNIQGNGTLDASGQNGGSGNSLGEPGGGGVISVNGNNVDSSNLSANVSGGNGIYNGDPGISNI